MSTLTCGSCGWTRSHNHICPLYSRVAKDEHIVGWEIVDEILSNMGNDKREFKVGVTPLGSTNDVLSRSRLSITKDIRIILCDYAQCVNKGEFQDFIYLYEVLVCEKHRVDNICDKHGFDGCPIGPAPCEKEIDI